MIVPKLLHKGDTVAITTASGPCSTERLRRGIKVIEAMGLNVRVMESCYAMHGGYLAGYDPLRLQDLHTAFADPNIKGIIMARGGYGAARLLPYLNYDMIRQNPKVFVGYSDVTALHTVFNQICGFATFHGPMVASCFNNEPHPVSLASFKQAIFEGIPTAPLSPLKTLVPGHATGILTGGNLSVIASLIGTPYEIKTRGRILFLEDIQEEPYRVDRLLLQLKLAGKLSDAAGIVLGDFTPETVETLHVAINELVVPEGIPTMYGLDCGHTSPNITLMLGQDFTIR